MKITTSRRDGDAGDGRLRSACIVSLACCMAFLALPAGAQQPIAVSPAADTSLTPAADLELPFAYAGPAPPVLPATMIRDEQGQTTVRAIRLGAPLRLDGQLDEGLYTSVTPITDFIQAEPIPGAAATEKTEVWISFDGDNVYVSVRASESRPDRMIVNEMRRDSNSLLQNENFAFSFDTSYDRRNGVIFQFNPIGGRMDGQNSNEGQYNGDWNPVWDFAIRRVEGGWTAEAAVPFKSLRYRPGRAQIWGFQSRRINRWKNEVSFLTRLPDGFSSNGIMRTSRFATLVGLEAPPGSRALDLKPYATSNLTSDLTASPAFRNDLGGDVGFDLKYGITQNLTADFTYNTDFAQVEADEQQVNLTRFSLFFPEKREFFLENQGLFNFGGVTASNAGDTPVLFYSRRIGLDQGHQVPIDAGGRVTGRIGRVSVGLLTMRTGDAELAGIPATNFSVARIKRDILRRSAVGAIVTRRSNATGATGSAETYGVDGTFAFYGNLSVNTYWATTRTPNVHDDDTSYRAQLDYNGDRYGVQIDQLRVGDNFVPDVGFVRRDNMRRSSGLFRFTPRPKTMKRVRKFGYEGALLYIENGAGRLETRQARGEFSVEFQSSDRIEIQYTDGYELLAAPFRIPGGVTVPAGGYALDAFRGQLAIGQQRKASGTVFVERGSFYGGNQTAVGYNMARVKVNPRLAIEPGISITRVNLPYGDFTTKLVSSRVTYTITPKLFVSTLAQYNSSNNSMSTNLRLRWEYQPGSEMFVVYNESRDTRPLGFPTLQNRSVVVKVNRLFRF